MYKPAHDKAEASEMISVISRGLADEERAILALVCDGYPAERIAGKLGLNISRVRYVIYEKIQPKARRYVGVE
jgi:DNA-binding NarL/FixJ family response regulator